MVARPGFEPGLNESESLVLTVTLSGKMEPEVRIELTTYRLQGDCTTTVLFWLPDIRRLTTKRNRSSIISVCEKDVNKNPSETENYFLVAKNHASEFSIEKKSVFNRI